MRVPEGLDIDPKMFILKLHRFLHGLKQAPKIWWEGMRNFILKSGFHCCEAELAVFVRHYNNTFIILLFVDDIPLTGTDKGIETFVEECSREFKTRDLWTPRLFLGIQIERCKDKIIIH